MPRLPRCLLPFFVLVLATACGAGSGSEPVPAVAPAAEDGVPPPRSTTAPPAEWLYEGDRDVTSLAVDADAVYWTMVDDAGTGAVARWSRSDGSVRILAEGRAAPAAVATAGGQVFWIDSRSGEGAVMRAGGDGQDVTVLARTSTSAATLAVRDGDVYFLDGRDETLWSVRASGGVPARVAALPGATFLAAGGADVFYLVDAVMRVGRDGRGPARVSEGCFYPTVLAVDEARAFWGCQDGTVRAVARSGGATTRLFARDVAGGNIGGIALDAAAVYFSSTSDGAIDRVSKNGGAVETLARSERVGAVAVDETSVYFAASGRRGARSALGRIDK